MFKNAKVGDRAFNYLYQEWGVITSVNTKEKFPIVAKFQDDISIAFTYCGKMNYTFAQTLFWDEVTITPPPKPLPKLEVDTQVIVWHNEDSKKFNRYFSHFSKGKIYCFNKGATSWSTTNDCTVGWDNWKFNSTSTNKDGDK